MAAIHNFCGTKMKIFKLSDMKDGWWIGDFAPAAFNTNEFEVAYKVHKKNEPWPLHYQNKATEINLLIRGQMAIETASGEGLLVGPGDIFIFEPRLAAKPFFLEDCEVVCVKVPSLPGDKVVC